MKNINAQINAARIAKINHSVTLNSTLSPYMLFPVRLETHFREAKVSTRSPHEKEVEDILRNFSTIMTRFRDTFLPQNAQPQTYSDTFPEAIYDLRANIEELDLLSSEDKAVIHTVAFALDKNMSEIAHISGNAQLQSYLNDIVNAAKSIETSTAIKENRGTIFMKELKANYTSLKTLAQYIRTPYRSKTFYRQPDKHLEENERLYRYVTGRAMRIAAFFNTAAERLKDVPSLDNRQRSIAINDFYADDFAKWNDLFSSVSGNMEKIYKGLSYQQQQLMKKYNEDWRKILADAQKKCRNFAEGFHGAIQNKPRTAFRYTRLLQSVLQLRAELLSASVARRLISFATLSRKVVKIASLTDKAFLTYSSEKNLIYELQESLQQDIALYCQYMKNENFSDYQHNGNNQSLSGIIRLSKIEQISTVNETFENQKQLCVRIFPDDIFIHQHDKLLTQEEAMDGKKFWIKYFIASENKIYEKEAWNILWRRYDAMRASWIARTLYPVNLPSFADRYPYKNNSGMETALSNLVDISNKYDVSESNTQSKNEANVLKCVEEMLPRFYEVRKIVMQYDRIVDYLYRKINGDLEYVKRRLDAFLMFYEKNPEYKKRADMAYRDIDYQAVAAFFGEVNDLIMHIREREVSLEEMVDEYMERLDKKDVFFPKIPHFRDPEKFAPPVSAILPNRFLFFGDTQLTVNGKKRKKRIVYAGRKVKKDLKLSIDIGEDANTNPYNLDMETGEIDVRGGIRWMTDYETAVKSGMAITVPLPHTDEQFLKAKFSVIYVLGIKDTPDANTLEDFFNGHIYGHSGLDFLKIGTPTNNLDGVVSGFNSDETLIEEKRFNIEVKQQFKNNNLPLFKSLNGVVGIEQRIFDNSIGRVTSFDNAEIEKAQETNKILCSVFGSSFNLPKNGTELRCKTSNFLKQIPPFVSSHCLARGVVPPLRIGNQPYGILPTTAFSRFEFEPPSDNLIKVDDPDFLKFARELHQLLKRITDIWSNIKSNRVISSEKLGTKNPQKRYLEMMNLTPTSVSFFERTLVESLPLLHPAINYMPIEKTNRSIARILKKVFDISQLENEKKIVLLDQLALFRAHPIQEMVVELKNEVTKDPDLRPFIDKILSKEKKNELKKLVPEEEIPLLVAEFMDLFTYRLDAWWLGLVNYQLKRIRKGDFGKASSANSIGAFGWLFNLEKRENNAKKMLPQTRAQEIGEEMKLRDRESPVFQDEQHNEFILAPSINHAITAAILRGSYKKSMKQDNDSRLCINLSSLRVRQALRVIEGLRNGLSIGAVLGADLERSLHEAYKSTGQELNRYIYPLRQQFPLKIDIKSEQKDPAANDYTMSIINGELLVSSVLQDYEAHRELPVSDYLLNMQCVEWFNNLFINRPPEHKKVVALLIEQIADTFDALSDLILSEGVYQLVQGNRVAFSALMQSMQDGRVFAQPQITEIPMHSAVVRHKAAIAFNAVSGIDLSGWNRTISSENAQNETVIEMAEWAMPKAEPALNQWVGTLLGNAEDICFVVSQTEIMDNEEVKTEVSSSLADLGISPLEYLYMSSNMSVFLRYIELVFRKKHRQFTKKITIDYKKKGESWETGKRSLFENEWMMENVRTLVANSRALSAEDFSTTVAQTDQENLKGIDVADLENRYKTLLRYAEKVENDFKQLSFKISAKKEKSMAEVFITEEELMQLADLLIVSASLGMTDTLTAYPLNLFEPKTSDEEQLKAQTSLLAAVGMAQKKLSENIDTAKKCMAELDASDEDSVVATYTNAIQSLLQKNFKIIPLFDLKPLPEEDRAAQSVQLQADFTYQNAAPMELEVWSGEVSKVREPMSQIQQIRMFSNLLDVEEGKTAVMQFPFNPEKDKEWLGLEVSSEKYVEDKESIVLFNSENFSADINRKHAGLMIDQWMELLPYEHQRGGVVFNFDQPNAEAPQTILLAVPSKITMRKRKGNAPEAKNWTLNDLIVTLNDTRIMAENRAVEPDHLYAETELAKIIPLLKYDKKKI